MNILLTMISTAALLTAIAGPALADQHEKTVFVTKANFKGNLGGLSGADAKCQAEADGPESIVPSGTYLAWLSDGTDSPGTRFSKSFGPYVLADGTRIAEHYLSLTDGSVSHAINIDATGTFLGMTNYWTGTNADGTTAKYTLTCDGWAEDPVARFKGMAGDFQRGPTLWSTGRTSVRCSVRA